MLPRKKTTVCSYSGYHKTSVDVYEPFTTTELKQLIYYFHQNNQSYSVMGRGISFDAHFINPSAIVSTRHLTRLRLDLDNDCIYAEAGVDWKTIAQALLPKGYVPLIHPTASAATVGGSFSVNSYSRMTAHYGREGCTILSFRLILPNGEERHCSRTQHAQLFHQAIGSYGLLGTVVEVQYRVKRVGMPLGFQSCAAGFEGINGLEHLLTRNDFEAPQHKGYKGSGAFIYWSGGQWKTLVTRHRWVSTAQRVPSRLHNDQFGRILGEIGLGLLPKIGSRVLSHLYNKTLHDQQRVPYAIDDPWGAMFWLDATRRSKALSRKIGLHPRTLQQSFAIPCAATPTADDHARVQHFTTYALQQLRQTGLSPTLVDIGYLPPGPTYGLSASPSEGSAFLLSITFEGRAIATYQRVVDFFTHLSQVGHRHYQVRIHLTKNVFCPSPLLRAMYASTLPALLDAKRQYDPKGLLTNELMERCFGLSELLNTPCSSYSLSK